MTMRDLSDNSKREKFLGGSKQEEEGSNFSTKKKKFFK
jgi:hypothetical protein